jgi:hypothetical protein
VPADLRLRHLRVAVRVDRREERPGRRPVVSGRWLVVIVVRGRWSAVGVVAGY